MVHIADDRAHVLLRRHDDPGPTAALRVEAFRNRLKIRHELDVVGDVLADLIDEEIEPELGLLCIDVGLHLVGKILDRRPKILPITHKDSLAL